MDFQLESGIGFGATLWLIFNYLIALLILIGAIKLYFRVMKYLKLKISELEK